MKRLEKQVQHLTAFPRLRNDEGVILLTVILMTIILSIVVVGVMSVNISHVKKGEDVLETIRLEELAKGVFYQYHQIRFTGLGTIPAQMVVDGKTYNISVDNRGISGPNGTEQISVCVENADYAGSSCVEGTT